MVEFAKYNIDLIVFIVFLLLLAIFRIFYAYKKRIINLTKVSTIIYESEKSTLGSKFYIFMLSLSLYRNIKNVSADNIIEFLEVTRKEDELIVYIIVVIIIFWGFLNIIKSKLLKVGVFDEGIITEYGDFIPWESMNKIFINESVLGRYKIIKIHTKEKSQGNFLNHPYKIYFSNEDYEEVLEEIAENTGMVFAK